MFASGELKERPALAYALSNKSLLPSTHPPQRVFLANERMRHRSRQWMEENCAPARCVFLAKGNPPA